MSAKWFFVLSRKDKQRLLKTCSNYLPRKDGTGNYCQCWSINTRENASYALTGRFSNSCAVTFTRFRYLWFPTCTRVFLRSVLYENENIFYTWRRVILAKPSRHETLRAKLYDLTLFLPFVKYNFRAIAI